MLPLLLAQACCVETTPATTLSVSCAEPSVGLGQALDVRVAYTTPSGAQAQGVGGEPELQQRGLRPGVPGGLRVWAFINGSQWGAPVTPPHTQLLLPMPRAGEATIQLALLPLSAFPSPANLPVKSPGGFPVGTPLAQVTNSSTLRSNTITVHVRQRRIAPPAPRSPHQPLVLIEWESEFSAHYNTWISREATPLCGLYSSYNTNVHRQHAHFLVEAGVDAVLMDWVDTLFSVEKGAAFDSNPAGAEDMDASVATAATWAKMREEGLATPLAVPLLGLDNSNPGTVPPALLQQQIEWTGRALRDMYPQLMLQHEGKPLLVIFDTTGTAMNGSYPGISALNTTGWSVKWMTAFENGRPEQAAAGYWSWTDGSATPVRSSAKDGSVEAVTVKPAYFRTPGGPGGYTFPGGWLAPQSQPQHQGATMLLQMRAAMQKPRPRFVIVSQFNEFTATACSSFHANGGPLPPGAPFRSCADTYNNSLTDDIEPTSLTECGDVKANDTRCGGWGFTALNFLRAAIWAGLRDPTAGADAEPCVLAIVTPDDESRFAAGTDQIEITWRTLAPVGDAVKFAVQIDGAQAECAVRRGSDASSCTVDTSHLESGEHVLAVSAHGAWTRLGVRRDRFDPMREQNIVPSASVRVHLRADGEGDRPPAPGDTPVPVKGDDEGACTSDLDCSLNGVCTAGSCSCDRPWTGASCGVLGFKPVAMPQGYGMVPNRSATWGGNILRENDDRFHLYVSAMTNDCALGDWSSNSRIEHGVADRPEGPFEFVGVAIPTQAHNSAPLRLHDGSFAIVHIGSGAGKIDGGRNCTNGSSVLPEKADAGEQKPPPKPKGSRIHVSKSIAGPWSPLVNESLPKENCDNPAPWQHPNGSLYVACGREIKGNLINLWRAEAITGPWTFVTGLNNSFSTPTPRGKKEDVFIYTDRKGSWHALWHAFFLDEGHRGSCVNSTVSMHTFSEDGHTWHAGAEQPYTTQVQTTTGVVTVSTRERPKLFFDEAGQMTHLVNGVSGAAQCEAGGPPSACTNCKLRSWDYTLVAPLDV